MTGGNGKSWYKTYLSRPTWRCETSGRRTAVTLAADDRHAQVGYRHWRRAPAGKPKPPLPIQAWDGCAADDVQAASAAEAAAVLHATLGRLSPRDRLVLTLMYLEGCSVAEIARLVGWSQTMVKVQAHRARGRLRKLLEERERDER